MNRRTIRAGLALAIACVTLSLAAPAFAGSAPWFGLYVPGAPSDVAPLHAAESAVGTHASVVNFFVADTEAFPTARCANVAADGSTPLVTLEFWSTQTGGLSAINGGSEDAYLHTFAAAARAYGAPVFLRPFHEMNGNWYPWGATGSNTPAQLVAAYRHVHDIFVSEGATNVKFVWCPNVDFNVTSFYPGNAYVDYAAIDGYNNGAPWRSFSGLFGATYRAVAGVTSRPIFIAETSCVEGGSGKAAWISGMFGQIRTSLPRIAGVCWFDAKQTYDWRVDTSPSSAAALHAGFSSTGLSLTASTGAKASSLSIKTPASTRRRRAVTVSGTLAGSHACRTVRVLVTLPNGRGSSRLLRTNASGRWSFRYTPTKRGTYHVKATFAGDSGLRASASKTLCLRVK